MLWQVTPPPYPQVKLYLVPRCPLPPVVDIVSLYPSLDVSSDTGNKKLIHGSGDVCKESRDARFRVLNNIGSLQHLVYFYNKTE